jgi:serine phosphatase RsbU (regulator of sigma subunit)
MRRSLGWPAATTLVLLLALTGFSTWLVKGTVDHQENRLLHERANEVALVLKEAVESLSSQLHTVGGVLRATDGDPKAFARSSAALVSASDGHDSIALLRRTPEGYRAALVSGRAFRRRQLVTGPVAETLAVASATKRMVSTPVMGAGRNRTLGFAVGPPASPEGTVLYLQLTLGALGPPTAVGTSPFNELHVVLYDAQRPDPSSAVVATTDDLPLRGEVTAVPVDAGASAWTLQVSPAHPLVGGTTAQAPWIVLGAGVVMACLITLIVESETRRRRNALTLYRNERQLAEGLQRSLLPELPDLATLDVAARYLPGSADQQIGGDWYDVFQLDGDRIGFAVGDVLGHDIEAAALMSRIQAALRAYAFVGHPPAAVLDHLDRLLISLGTERLVTVFFGILGPDDGTGRRELTFSNAGHPAPIVHDRTAGVCDLDGVTSLLLGVVGGEVSRPQSSVVLTPGATLVLYTDGLVEVPGESLTDHVERLKQTLAANAGRCSPEQLCDLLLEGTTKRPRRDDVAVLAARLVSSDVPATPLPRRVRLTALRRQ